MMKRAVTVTVETANAQSYRRYTPTRPNAWQAYTPPSSGAARPGVRTAPFSDPNGPEATGGGNPGYNQRIHY